MNITDRGFGVIKPQGCHDCYYYATSPLASPGGNCHLHNVSCSDFSTCESWLDRKEGAAMRQVMLAANILDNPDEYDERMQKVAETVLERGGKR